MRYILWVVEVLEEYDVTNNGRHLGFYRELEIRFKPREMVIFCPFRTFLYVAVFRDHFPFSGKPLIFLTR